jgi:hypothetical protein
MATTDTEGDTRNEAEETGNSGLRQHASEAYETARQKTAAAYGAARDGASKARQQTADTIDTYPLAAVIGGFAIGALVAGLLPRTERENETLGALGGRINDPAREAALAARDAGREKLDELGFNKEGLSERLSDFASSASAAIRSSRRSGNSGD